MTRLLFLLLFTGCASLLQLVSPGATASSTGPGGSHHIGADNRLYRVGPFWGPECERIGAPRNEVQRDEAEAEPTMGKQPNIAHDPADQILRVVCVERVLSSFDEPERDTWVMQHFRFDELFFDHLTAAMMLVQCLEAESCLGEGAAKLEKHVHNELAQKMIDAQPKGRRIWQDYEIGMMRWYAEHVDPAEVARRLAKVPLPGAAQQAFLALLGRATARVMAVTAELAPDEKRLFVELPAAVYKQRAAERARHATIIDQLGMLIERVRGERASGPVTDDTLEQLRKLRHTYHDGCKSDCTRDPIFAAITRQIFWAFVARGDGPGAMAESKLLAQLDPSAVMEIATKQSAAIDAARGRVQRVVSARQQGIDPDAARSTANGALVDLGDGRYVYRWHRDFAIDWEALVPEAHEVGHFGGKVAGLERRGANVLVRFQDEFSSTDEDTDCHETNRIDGISSDGTIRYRQACSGHTTHVERRKVEPAMVPAGEAAGLHGGEELVGFARGTGEARLGHIWLLRRGNRVVRLRDMPL